MIRPLWIEVDLKALRHNLEVVKNHMEPKVKIIATIKQSAYGHGLVPVARELARAGIDFFGLGDVEEAISLREDGFRGSIIILSAILDKFVTYFLQYDLIPTIVDLEFAKKLNAEALRRGKTVSAHVKIDTGMGRLGLYYKKARVFIKKLSKLKNISLEGIYTHFPVADSDPEFTNYQIAAFNGFIRELKKEGIFFRFCHCANSLGIINYPKAHFNMVRPGLVLYGVKPSPNLGLDIKPILSLKSKVIFVKRIDRGRGVSYGRTYIADKPKAIATVAVGYADGYPWSLSNRGKVIINNSFFNIAGRVCMDHVMIDLGDSKDIKIGQEVILIGKAKTARIGAEDLAQWAKTIPYEIVSRLSLKIPRVYNSFSSRWIGKKKGKKGQ